ncbi:MAG: DUF4157 domain-containing protein [Deltaproteobacteria bacterium]|nr:MAG: DUF4157 domain-containing protein [Deltaproteobacteria bacterium]
MHGKVGKGSLAGELAHGVTADLPVVGKQTLTEAITSAHPASVVVQRNSLTPAPLEDAAAVDVARRGTDGAGGPLPHRDRIQLLFGRHDISGVTAHEGPAASQAARSLGAQAYAHGNAVAFASPPDLHTAAHEAAHVVQQRVGVQLKGGIDRPGDTYERHADAVADAVVAGRSAEPLLDQFSATGQRVALVQRVARFHRRACPRQAAAAGDARVRQRNASARRRLVVRHCVPAGQHGPRLRPGFPGQHAPPRAAGRAPPGWRRRDRRGAREEEVLQRGRRWP